MSKFKYINGNWINTESNEIINGGIVKNSDGTYTQFNKDGSVKNYNPKDLDYSDVTLNTSNSGSYYAMKHGLIYDKSSNQWITDTGQTSQQRKQQGAKLKKNQDNKISKVEQQYWDNKKRNLQGRVDLQINKSEKERQQLAQEAKGASNVATALLKGMLYGTGATLAAGTLGVGNIANFTLRKLLPGILAKKSSKYVLDKTTDLDENTKSTISNGIGFGVGFGSGNLLTKALTGAKDFYLFDKVYMPAGLLALNKTADKVLDITGLNTLGEWRNYVAPIMAAGFQGVGSAFENTLGLELATSGNNLFQRGMLNYGNKITEGINKYRNLIGSGKSKVGSDAVSRWGLFKANNFSNNFDNGSNRLMVRILPTNFEQGEKRIINGVEKEVNGMNLSLNHYVSSLKSPLYYGAALMSAGENFGKGVMNGIVPTVISDSSQLALNTETGNKIKETVGDDIINGLLTAMMVYGSKGMRNLTKNTDGTFRWAFHQGTEGLAGGIDPIKRLFTGIFKNYNGNIAAVENPNPSGLGKRAADSSGYGEGVGPEYNHKNFKRDSSGFYDHGRYKEGWIYPESSSLHDVATVHDKVFGERFVLNENGPSHSFGSRYERRLPGLERVAASDMSYKDYMNFMHEASQLPQEDFYHLNQGDITLGFTKGVSKDGKPIALEYNSRGHWLDNNNGYYDQQGSGSGSGSLFSFSGNRRNWFNTKDSELKKQLKEEAKEHGTKVSFKSDELVFNPTLMDNIKYYALDLPKGIALSPVKVLAKSGARWLDNGAYKLVDFSTKAHEIDGNPKLSKGKDVRAATAEDNTFDVYPGKKSAENAAEYYDKYDKINIDEFNQLDKVLSPLLKQKSEISGEGSKQKRDNINQQINTVLSDFSKTSGSKWSLGKFEKSRDLISRKQFVDSNTNLTDEVRLYYKDPNYGYQMNSSLYKNGGLINRVLNKYKSRQQFSKGGTLTNYLLNQDLL